MKRINNPEDFGLSISSYDCLEGQVPCLLVEPDGIAGAGKRGKLLRQQLVAKRVELTAYGQVRGIVVLLHGRNGRKEDLLPVAERFVAAGFRCVLLDLPAHGDSPIESMSFGSSEFERQIPRRVLTEVKSQFGLPDEPAVLWGLSMGGAFAVNAASEPNSDWDAVMVVSSFASLEGVLESQVSERWRPLVPLLLSLLDIERSLQHMPSISSIQPKVAAHKITIPSLTVHGDQDHFVSTQQGYELYKSIESKDKKWLTVKGASHSNVLGTTMPLYAEMNEWLAQVLDENSARKPE